MRRLRDAALLNLAVIYGYHLVVSLSRLYVSVRGLRATKSLVDLLAQDPLPW